MRKYFSLFTFSFHHNAHVFTISSLIFSLIIIIFFFLLFSFSFLLRHKQIEKKKRESQKQTNNKPTNLCFPLWLCFIFISNNIFILTSKKFATFFLLFLKRFRLGHHRFTFCFYRLAIVVIIRTQIKITWESKLWPKLKPIDKRSILNPNTSQLNFLKNIIFRGKQNVVFKTNFVQFRRKSSLW